MNETLALKDAENALRDFIFLTLKDNYGEGWLENSKLTPEKIESWKKKFIEEQKKLEAGATENRLIYFAEFHDLPILVEKNWGLFKPVFDDLKEFKALFKILSNLRNPLAHHRELLTFQKHLIVGISGYFRTQIVKYRSKMVTEKDIFPRIESVNDNYGNIWTPEVGGIQADIILKPGDDLEFTVKATDPQDGLLQFSLHPQPLWQNDNVIRIKIDKEHIGNPTQFVIVMRSGRDYHADGEYDGAVSFTYRIYPHRP